MIGRILLKRQQKNTKRYAKNNKEQQSIRAGKEKKSNSAVNISNTEEEIEKTKGETSSNENVVKCTG